MEANARLGGAEADNISPENRDGALTEEEAAAAKKARATNKKTWGEWAKGVKTFIWNPETRQFMGRTAKSWTLIIIFYLILYSFLAGMFTFGLYVMLLTMSPYTPTYRDRIAPPGVMIRPYVDNTFNIAFNVSHPNTWKRYVDNLEAYLKAYDDAAQDSKNIQCVPGQYFIQEGESKLKKACRFKRSTLTDCSGLTDKSFGYSSGKPCILLKMNRIVGYEPGYGTPVTVSCKVHKGDESALLGVQYYPSNTFDPMYFPYYGKHTHLTYAQPVVAMHFTVTRNKVMTIQCQLNGKGIINNYNNDKFLGRVIFVLQVGN